MAKQKKTENKETAPTEQAPLVETDNIEQKKRSTTFVVVREGYRVSDNEYEIANDPVAISEKDFWTRVAKNHSYGEPVEIVQYDPKKHRVW